MHIEQKTNRIFRPIGNTTLSAEETNQVTTEIENQITAGGLTPNASTLTQLRDSIQNVVDTAANDLQSQIDAITSSSDVFDVVGTYAQLQAYDTSTVPVNDIIKVLKDETRQNAMTYYRWNGTTWVFIGAEGPYYTVAETDTKFALKTQLPGIATTQQAGLVKPDGQSVLIGQDGTLSVAQTMSASLPLFTCQFTDHLLNDASYLRADTFSWNSGAVYISAYQHLVDDIAGKTAETETISGITITFYRATDGHKIVLADQESNVSAIYTATGVAWYYILDTANTRFKLPRSQWNFVGLRDNVGNYVESNGLSGNDIHATQTYLYFYVGNTVQSQTTIDVGQITEALNTKADTDLGNVSATGKATAIGWGEPDFTAGVTFSIPYNNPYTAQVKGWVHGYIIVGSGYMGYVYVNGETVQASGSVSIGTIFPVAQGDIVTTNSAQGNFVFYPCKGAN